jgi:methyl-accepting chemotaxis protein
MQQLTLRQRLAALAVTSILAVGLVGVIGTGGIIASNKAATELIAMSDALTTHMIGDMMHDALHSDVLGALLHPSTRKSGRPWMGWNRRSTVISRRPTPS